MCVKFIRFKDDLPVAADQHGAETRGGVNWEIFQFYEEVRLLYSTYFCG